MGNTSRRWEGKGLAVVAVFSPTAQRVGGRVGGGVGGLLPAAAWSGPPWLLALIAL